MQEAEERRIPKSEKISLNLKAKKVKIIFQPEKLKSTTLKSHTKEIMKKIMKKIWKRILKRSLKKTMQQTWKKNMKSLNSKKI